MVAEGLRTLRVAGIRGAAVAAVVLLKVTATYATSSGPMEETTLGQLPAPSISPPLSPIQLQNLISQGHQDQAAALILGYVNQLPEKPAAPDDAKLWLQHAGALNFVGHPTDSLALVSKVTSRVTASHENNDDDSSEWDVVLPDAYDIAYAANAKLGNSSEAMSWATVATFSRAGQSIEDFHELKMLRSKLDVMFAFLSLQELDSAADVAESVVPEVRRFADNQERDQIRAKLYGTLRLAGRWQAITNAWTKHDSPLLPWSDVTQQCNTLSQVAEAYWAQGEYAKAEFTIGWCSALLNSDQIDDQKRSLQIQAITQLVNIQLAAKNYVRARQSIEALVAQIKEPPTENHLLLVQIALLRARLAGQTSNGRKAGEYLDLALQQADLLSPAIIDPLTLRFTVIDAANDANCFTKAVALIKQISIDNISASNASATFLWHAQMGRALLGEGRALDAEREFDRAAATLTPAQAEVRIVLAKLALLKYRAMKAQSKVQDATAFVAALKGSLAFSHDQLAELAQAGDSAHLTPDPIANLYLSLAKAGCASAYCRARLGAQSTCHNPKYRDLNSEVRQIVDLKDDHNGIGVEAALAGDIECSETINGDRARLFEEFADFFTTSELSVLAHNLRQDAWGTLPELSESTARIRQSLAEDLARDETDFQASTVWSDRAIKASDFSNGPSSFESSKLRLALFNAHAAPYIDVDAESRPIVTFISSAGLDNTMHLYRTARRAQSHNQPALRRRLESLIDAMRNRVESIATQNNNATPGDELREVLGSTTRARELYTLSPIAFEKLASVAVPSIETFGSMTAKEQRSLAQFVRNLLRSSMRQGNSALTLRIWTQAMRIGPLLNIADKGAFGGDQFIAAQAYADIGDFSEALGLMSGTQAMHASVTDVDQAVSRLVMGALRQAAAGSPDRALDTLSRSIVVAHEFANHRRNALLRLTLATESIASCISGSNNVSVVDTVLESLRDTDTPTKLPYSTILASINMLFVRGDMIGARKIVDAVIEWQTMHGRSDGNTTIAAIAGVVSNMNQFTVVLEGVYAGNEAFAYQFREGNASLIEDLNAQSIAERSKMDPFELWRAYLALKSGDFVKAKDQYAALLQQVITNPLTKTYFDGATMDALIGILFANAGDADDAEYFLKSAQARQTIRDQSVTSDTREDALASLEGLILQLRRQMPEAVRRFAKPDDGRSVIFGPREFLREIFKAEDFLSFALPPGRSAAMELGVAQLAKERRTLLVDAAARMADDNDRAAEDATKEAFVALQYLAAAHSIESSTFALNINNSVDDDFTEADLNQRRVAQAAEWTARRFFDRSEGNLQLALEPIPASCSAIPGSLPDYSSWMLHKIGQESAGEVTGIVANKRPAQAPRGKLPKTASAVSKMMKEARQRVESLSPTPATISEVQKRLKSDDALVIYYTAEQYTYAMSVTRRKLALKRIARTREQLEAAVSHLLEGATKQTAVQQIPFLAESNSLYREVLAPFEVELAGVRHLTITGSGPIMRLPFSLLVSRPYSGPNDSLKAYRDADWLDKRVQVRRLVALSHQAASLDRPEISKSGTGPVLVGFSSPDLPDPSQCETNEVPHSGSRQRAMICKIAGTEDFVPELASQANAAVGIHKSSCISTPDPAGRASICISGPAFTQEAVRQIGLRLDSGSVVVFASHGLLSQQTAQLNGALEPAIVTSANGSKGDGIMTVSEVSGLTFPAGLVILTACNSSAPDSGEFDDTSSGLVQAFMFAGARQVIVTNWQVLSDPALDVTSQTLHAIFKDKASAAEALNEAMITVRNMAGVQRPEEYLQPLYWAGFSLVDKYL